MNRRARVVGLVALLVAIPVLLALWTSGSADDETSAVAGAQGALMAVDTSARAPVGVRVRVQVLNSSGRTGLARRATQQLRDLGYDVVDYNSRGDTLQLTEVQVTSASRAWGERIANALGRGRVRERAGSLGYVDVVVLLGHDWQPSPQPLRP